MRKYAMSVVLIVVAAVVMNASGAWTYNSAFGTIYDASGTVLNVSAVEKYGTSGLQIDSVSSTGTESDLDFTGFTTPGDGYSVISISNNCFKGNKKLTSLTAPEVIYLGEGAFMNSVSLTNVVISADVMEMRGDVFNGCTSLNWFSPSVFNKLTRISGNAFKEAKLENAMFEFPKVSNCDATAFYINQSGYTSLGPTKIVMTNVVSVGGSAFFGRYNTEFDGNLPNLVVATASSIAQFRHLKIYDANMPRVKVVTQEMFSNCASLTNVVVSPECESIGTHAFLSCPLENVSDLLTTNLSFIGTGAFYGTRSPEIVFNCPKINCLTNNIFLSCGKTTNIVIKSHVDTLCESSLTGLAGGVAIRFEKGAPSNVATNAITYVTTDMARARVYLYDDDLPTSGFAAQLEPIEESDKAHTGRPFTGVDKQLDWPGRRVRGKVKGWYKYGNTFRLSYYYIIGIPKINGIFLR